MKDLTLLLEKLSEKLGTTSEYLWMVLLKQAKIAPIIGAFEVLLFILVFYLYYKGIRLIIKKKCLVCDSDHVDYEVPAWAFIIIGGITSIILFIVGICIIESSLVALLNPEYWAIKEIINFVK